MGQKKGKEIMTNQELAQRWPTLFAAGQIRIVGRPATEGDEQSPEARQRDLQRRAIRYRQKKLNQAKSLHVQSAH